MALLPSRPVSFSAAIAHHAQVHVAASAADRDALRRKVHFFHIETHRYHLNSELRPQLEALGFVIEVRDCGQAPADAHTRCRFLLRDMPPAPIAPPCVHRVCFVVHHTAQLDLNITSKVRSDKLGTIIMRGGLLAGCVAPAFHRNRCSDSSPLIFDL